MVLAASWFEGGHEEGERKEAFNVSERRLGPNGTGPMAWCPRMDLVALGTNAGRVCLYRHIWQRVWTLPPLEEGIAVTHLHWREDGKVLLVAHANGSVRLYDIEKPTLLHTITVQGCVTACGWRTTQPSQTQSSEKQADSHPLSCNPNVAPAPHLRRFAPKFDVPAAFEGERFVDDAEANPTEDPAFDVLALGTDKGVVHLFGCGCIPMGQITCPSSEPIQTLSLSLSSASVVLTQSSGEHHISVQQVPLSALCRHLKEQQRLCIVQRVCSGLSKYLECTLQCMMTTWHSFLQDLDHKFSAFLKHTAPGVKLHDELLVLLVTGKTQSLELQAFLTRELARRSLQNMVSELKDSFSSLEQLVYGYMDPALDGIIAATDHLQALPLSNATGHERARFSTAARNLAAAAATMKLKAQEMLRRILETLDGFEAFMDWIRVTMQHLNKDTPVERMPAYDASKISAFIVEYLTPDPEHQRTSVDTIYQYFEASPMRSECRETDGHVQWAALADTWANSREGVEAAILQALRDAGSQGLDEAGLCRRVRSSETAASTADFDVTSALLLLEEEGVVRFDEDERRYTAVGGTHGSGNADRAVGPLGDHRPQHSLFDCLKDVQAQMANVVDVKRHLLDKRLHLRPLCTTQASSPLSVVDARACSSQDGAEVHRALVLPETQRDVVLLEVTANTSRAARVQFGSDAAVLAVRLYGNDSFAAVVQLKQQELVFCLIQYDRLLQEVATADVIAMGDLMSTDPDDISFRILDLPSPSVGLAVGSGRQLGIVCSSREHFVVLDLGADEDEDEDDDDDDEEEDEEGEADA